MQGKALVFSGGGAKGAYEAGVMKALHEIGLDRQIRMVAGTSAGSLNAVLFAQGNVEETLEIWSTVSNSQILTANAFCQQKQKPLCADEKKQLSSYVMQELKMPLSKTCLMQSFGVLLYEWLLRRFLIKLEDSLTPSLAKALVPCFLNILQEVKTSHDFITAIQRTIYFIKMIIKDGLFSQEGLKQILNEHYHPMQLLHSSVLVNATAFDLSKERLVHFDLTASNQSIHKDILLASSAIPFVFDPVIINDHVFIDGGIPVVGDNTPVNVVYEAGYRDIIAVVLNADAFDMAPYADAHITVIQPQQSLGSALASLDFDEAYTKKLILQGYTDALRKLA